jgi:hypothetical protein
MVQKKATMSLVVAFVLMNLIGCNLKDDLLNLPQTISAIKDGILYTIRTEKQIYELGESVKVDFIIKNISSRRIDVGLSTISSDFKISIKRGNELVFLWPQWVLWAVSNFSLDVGESKQYSYTWDSTNNIFDSENYGHCVPAGVYAITMELWSYTHRGNVSVNIEIK